MPICQNIKVKTSNGNPLSCEFRSDEIWFTVSDGYGEPIATIERPHRGNSAWRAYAPNGKEIGKGYSMKIQAMRAIAIWLEIN